MKLPDVEGETAPVEREKNQQGRLEGIFADPLLPGGGIQCGGGGHCGGDRRGGQSAGRRAACRGDAV